LNSYCHYPVAPPPDKAVIPPYTVAAVPPSKLYELPGAVVETPTRAQVEPLYSHRFPAASKTSFAEGELGKSIAAIYFIISHLFLFVYSSTATHDNESSSQE
jgi:hypothetical protein